MKKPLYFLSGIPRSGSTVLAAILNQNPKTHVSTTSGLVLALDGIANTWHSHELLKENDLDNAKLVSTMRSMITTFYSDVEKPIIIDKSRGWPIPMIIHAMGIVLGHKPKIIATVRSIPDCAASFVRVAKSNSIDEFMESGKLMDHLKAAYISLQSGYNYDPTCFLFIEYDDLISNPKKELQRIHEFLNLPPFDYDFDNIDGSSVKEDDEKLHGFAGMHDIKSKLEAQHNQDPKDVLGHYYYNLCQPEFWLETPRTKQKNHKLDFQLTASINGDFETGWKIAQELEIEEPWNNRAAYNRGWYFLRQGKIQQGYQLMDRGRSEHIFGNDKPNVPTKTWDGRYKGIILLNLEGGLGDQIHQVRYAKEIASRGCKVIVSCTGQLASLFITVEGVSAVIQHEAVFGIYHDFWIAGMSAVIALGLELDNLSGKSYIKKPITITHKRKRIGLRWSGNPRFEHEQHRTFDPNLMFEAVKHIDADFISLQRDEGTDLCPEWVQKVDLTTWEDTRAALSSCDLVITSCTSVSHLAGAMGIETWVILPIMPYFLYAIDGEKTPYYDSFILFRQEIFGNWEAPFKKIKDKLNENFNNGSSRCWQDNSNKRTLSEIHQL